MNENNALMVLFNMETAEVANIQLSGYAQLTRLLEFCTIEQFEREVLPQILQMCCTVTEATHV